MNTLKGLITKDLSELKSFKRTIIVFIFIFSFSALTQQESLVVSNTFISMMALGFGMISIATFGYDDLAKADKYILSLPVSRKDIILSKYILIIVATLLGAIVGLVLSKVALLVLNKPAVSISELIITGLVSVALVGLLEAIQVPCIVKYGSEKGRLQVFVIAAIIALVVGGIMLLVEKFNVNIPTGSIENIFNNFWGILLPVVIIIEYAISYLCSYKIYSKKEF